MNPNEFEQHLQRQPLRHVPQGWRHAILAHPRHQPEGAASPGEFVSLALLRGWLWPHPATWGILASCWVLIFGLNRAARPSSSELAEARDGARIAVLQAQVEPASLELLREDPASPHLDRPPRPRPDAGLIRRNPHFRFLTCITPGRSIS